MRKKGKVSRNFSFTTAYRYDILSKTTLCTAVFYTVQTEQAGDFLGPGRKRQWIENICGTVYVITGFVGVFFYLHENKCQKELSPNNILGGNYDGKTKSIK